MEVIWQGLGFIILLIVLTKFLKKPISASLKKRREEIKQSFDQLRQKKEEMEANIAEWERKINSLSQEIVELHRQIIAEGEAERERIIAHAQQEGEHLKKQAHIVAEQELIKAIRSLKKETVDLATTMAQDLLKNVFQPSDQERLVKEFIKQLGAMA
ncbi:MAG: hypothetical protein ACPL5I_01720 [Thermodesulfobacteriota bacterium]